MCHQVLWKRVPEGQVLGVSLAINHRSETAAENMSWQDDGLNDLMHFPSLNIYDCVAPQECLADGWPTSVPAQLSDNNLVIKVFN